MLSRPIANPKLAPHLLITFIVERLSDGKNLPEVKRI
jgi:hypothetical protein